MSTGATLATRLRARLRPAGIAGPAQWAAAAAATLAHIIALDLSYILPGPDVVGWLFPVVAVLPGVATMALLPGGWKRWYRTAALLGLVLIATNPYIVLAFGETWMLHRMWVTERRIRLKDLFDPAMRRAAVTPVCFKPGPAPKKKARAAKAA